jgi:Family of unknown function (DUF6516)
MDVLIRDGFVETSALSFTRVVAADGRTIQILLEGMVYCSDGVAVDVTRYMDVRGATGLIEVISTYYRYHAWRPGRTGESLIRYDQAHDADHPHYHRFDRDGALVRYDDLTLEAMPRLDAVIREAVDLAREWDASDTD